LSFFSLQLDETLLDAAADSEVTLDAVAGASIADSQPTYKITN
jgi:hypothetical protein